MSFLLDTNVCIEILRGRNPNLQERLQRAGQENLAICAIVRAELLCGARLARDPARELARLAVFDELQDYPFDSAAAEQYSLIRVHLQQQGRLIGAYDLLIAAIALAYNLTLVTHNTSEFSRVPGLQLEDWQELPGDSTLQ
jgi:tRNA(fMet)-specific endonuclease VapC